MAEKLYPDLSLPGGYKVSTTESKYSPEEANAISRRSAGFALPRYPAAGLRVYLESRGIRIIEEY
jgi:hypothetical protein